MLEYYVVDEENVDTIAEKTGQMRSYFDETLKDCVVQDQTLVVFRVHLGWKEIRIHRAYPVEFVMHRLTDRYS